MNEAHNSKFVALVMSCKKHINETDVTTVHQRQLRGDSFCLIDVREAAEWVQGHLPNAIHLSKGIIERDIEKIVPNSDTEILLYCGGGYRSALAAANLQKMGYTNVTSVDGGFGAWEAQGFPITLTQ